MSEENESKNPEEISAPQAPRLNPNEGSDIVGAGVEKERSRSAVVGMVDRPRAEPNQQRRGRGGRRGQRGGPPQKQQEEDSGLIEKVVHINRCAKVVAGGRRFSFAALVVVGNGEGEVGVGYGKAKEVPECIRKGTERAKKNMSAINRRNNTIPHAVIGEHDGGKVLLRPATPGTGVIAGGGVRAVLEAAGVKDVLTKSLRSNNPAAMVNATIDALRQLRSKEQIFELRKAEADA
jgi:small subunit ribosomal protein S5